MEENAKWQRYNAINSTFKISQTNGFIIFVNSKVAGEYETEFKDFINNLTGE